jgi:hypothetical protein
MQGTLLLFMAVIAYSFIVVSHNSHRIEEESKDRRDDVCAAVNESFARVVELVDALTPLPPNPTPEQVERQQQIRELTRKILVASESCQPGG